MSVKKYAIIGALVLSTITSWASQVPEQRMHDDHDQEGEMEFGTIIKTTEQQDKEYSVPQKYEHHHDKQEKPEVT